MQRVEFKGMVRCTSLQNNADGNCEEIVNLRLDAGAWWVVGQKTAIVEGVDYEQVYVHQYGTFENFIGLKDGKVVWFASLEDRKIVEKNQEVCAVSGDVGFNQLNNILLICDQEKIIKIIFSGDKYGVTTIRLLDVPILEISQRKPDTDDKTKMDNEYSEFNVHFNKIDEVNKTKETIRGLFNKEKERYPGYVEGYTFLCMSYQLFDGSETKPTPPKLVEVGEYLDDVLEVKDLLHDNTDYNSTAKIRIGNMQLKILKVKVVKSITEEFREIVKRVNVYATPIRSFYDLDKIRVDYVASESEEYKKKAIPKKELVNEEVEKQLFYRVMSVDVADEQTAYTEIKFDNTLTTNQTLPVDTSGWLDRSGDMFVYNNRLHLYNIRQRFVGSQKIGECWYPYAKPEESNLWGVRDMAAFVYLKVGQKEVVVRYDCRLACPDSDNLNMRFPKVVSFPDSRACQIAFYDRNVRSTPFVVKLRPSATYNFAFGLVDQTTVAIPATGGAVEFPEESNYMEDNMNLIVSEAMNPYYFPPAHSYLMPGEIVNLAVNTQQISASQIGQFPVYVFTTEGIYALQIGEGKVLYGNMIPISAEVALRGGAVLQTKYGILFVTDKGLKVIAGAEVTEVSKAVTGRLDLAYRDNEVYRRVMDHPKMGVRLQDCVSVVPFEEYAPGAVMGYDIVEDEVIVSNPAFRYSYVFSLGTKTWHKITDVFVGFNRHLGLQEYLAAPVSARARVDVACTIKPGYMQSYRWSVGIPDLTLPAGRTTISTDDKTLYNATATSPITLKEALGLLAVPKFVARYEPAANKLYLSEKSTRLYIRGNNVPPQSFPVANDPAELPVAPVGEGEIVRLTLAGREFSHTTQGTDTAATVAGEIAAFVRGCGFEAMPDEDGLFVLASPGAAGNDTQCPAVQSSPHVGLSVTPFSGGREAHPAKRVCDIREEDGALISVYLQTRPVNLGGFGFKKVRHFYLSGELKPALEKYHGLFLFASDDQETWACVADAGFVQDTPRMGLAPVGQSHRYFVISTGGMVRPGHVVAGVEVEEEGRYDNRLR